MHETALARFNLESPDLAVPLAPGSHRVRGWVLPRSGGNFVDVRVWAGSKRVACAHGFPRPDLATFFSLRNALAEFTCEIVLEPGTTELRFEALDLSGKWHEFARRTVHVDATLPLVSVSTPAGAYRWHDFCRGLDAVLRARRDDPAADWTTLARRIAAALPYPGNIHSPTLPLIGFLDEPAAATTSRFGRVPLIGHVFHTSAPIARILASADLQVLTPLAYGHLQPSVGVAHPHSLFAAASGYLGFVDVPAQLPNPVALRVYAELEDGSLHLAQVAHTRIHGADEEKFSYVSTVANDFDQALAAWRQALVDRAIPLIEDADFHRGLELLHAQYLARTTFPAHRQAESIPPHSPHRHPLPRRVLLVTHNLNLEGAPLFLLDYARHLAAAGIAIEILSPLDGALRTSFTQAGMRVHLVDTAAIFSATSQDEIRTALAQIATFDFSRYDLVVCNTFTTFWAVHAAKAVRCRVLLYVHESTSPACFYDGRLHRDVLRLAETAFALADCVSFTTASTRRYHLDYGRPENHRITPGWVNVTAIDRWLDTHPKESLRETFGLAPGELLVTNVGTVSERKGQHIFVRAVDLLWQRHPDLARRTRFVMLGARQSDFDQALRDLVQAVQRPNLEIHAEAANYLRYYAAADLTACTSYEESSPRVVLEAMACGTPLLASAVHGIPEIARHDREAILLPAGDTYAWCEALACALADPASADRRAQRAQERVRTEFAADLVLPRHLALTAAVAAL